MKKFIFLILLITASTQSQNYTKVDALVDTYPRFSRVENLANKIAKDFNSDEEKARAAFYWLATNIRYNIKEYYNPRQRSYRFKYSSEEDKQQKLQAFKDKIIKKTFLSKTGICEEYAQSFKKICDLLDIEAQVIKGFVRNSPKEIGRPKNNSNHAWNAVKLNDKWIILDATWAAGHELNGKWVRKFKDYFYNIPKDKIFKTHYPEDSIWVLRFGRMSLDEFYKQPIYNYALLNSNAELLTPKTGVLKVNASKEIKLTLKNLDKNDVVYYAFRGQQYIEKPIINVVENNSLITIKNAQKNSFLTIYINKKAALQFKTE